MSYLDAALDAAGRGYHVWPLRADGKNPAVGKFKNMPDFGLTDPEMVRAIEWDHGVCIMLGPGEYVLDADTEESSGVIAGYNTLRVKTDRGMHAYFSLPAGLVLRQGSRVAKNIDGKGVASTGTRSVIVWAKNDGRHIVNDAPVLPLPWDWIERIGAPRTDGGKSRVASKEEVLRWQQKFDRIQKGAPRSLLMGERAQALRALDFFDAGSLTDMNRAACLMGNFVAQGVLGYQEAVDLVIGAYTGSYPNIHDGTPKGVAFGARQEEKRLNRSKENA